MKCSRTRAEAAARPLARPWFRRLDPATQPNRGQPRPLATSMSRARLSGCGVRSHAGRATHLDVAGLERGRLGGTSGEITDAAEPSPFVFSCPRT